MLLSDVCLTDVSLLMLLSWKDRNMVLKHTSETNDGLALYRLPFTLVHRLLTQN